MTVKRILHLLVAGALLAIFAPVVATAQTDNTYYVKQYPGQDVGAKVAAAMHSCSTTLPCILVIDPSLAAWPAGSMPTLCTTCSLQDYRAGIPQSVQVTASMPNWYNKLISLKNGVGFPRIAFIGDSTFFGGYASVATSPGVDFCNDITTYYGVPCTWNSWFGGGNPGSGTYWQSDSRIIAGSGWGVDSSVPTVGIEALSQSASGGALTFSPTSAADTYEIYYIKQQGGGTFAVSLEDGTTGTINTSTSGAASMQRYTLVANSGAGLHTLSHSWASGGKIDLVGDVAYNSGTPSVIALLMSAGGANSDQLSNATQPYSPGYSAPYSTIGLDAAIVEGGLINDWFGFPSAAKSRSNLQTLVSAILNAGSDVAMYTPVPSNPTAGKSASVQSNFVSAMRSVAAANKNAKTSSTLPIVDNFSAWGSYANHPQWYADGAVHPNQNGYEINAQAMEFSVMQAQGIGGGFNIAPWISGQGFNATTLAPNASVVSSPYTVSCTEGAIYITGGSVMLPANCPANFELNIVNFVGYAGATAVNASNKGGGFVASIAGNSSALYQFVGGAWWTVGQSYNDGGISKSLKLNGVVTSTAYTVVGTEGAIFATGNTVTLPDLGSSFNGFTVPIFSFGSSVNLTVTGANNNGVPVSLGAYGSAILTYYTGAWYAVSSAQQPLTGTTGSIGGSALSAGACATGTASVSGVNSYFQVPKASPTTYNAPGSQFVWNAYIIGANTVGVKVCALVAGTPTATTYSVQVN